MKGVRGVTSLSWPVLGRASLSPEEAEAVRDLVATCDAADGLRLKISLYATPAPPDTPPNMFLVYDGGALVGCWSVDYDGGREAETCGAVLPGLRRRGIGRALLGAARESVRARGAGSVLLICEDASASGRAFVEAQGGQPRHKELHMERPAGLLLPSLPGVRGVSVRPGTRADVDALVRIMTAAFNDDEAAVRRRVLSEVDDPAMPYFVIAANGSVIGSLKPYELTGIIGMYAVGVLPEQQGMGYGKRLMVGAMAWLSARHPGVPFALEVDPDNASAITLYEHAGFAVKTVYGYYAL
jgi:ribosomal protein S18 acetylase RimI-like enzyme